MNTKQWTVDIDESPLDEMMEIKVVNGEKSVCFFLDCNPEDYKNARLIAAAPELLENLRRVTNLLDICGFGVDAEDAVRAATEAIAKATGEAT